MFHLKQKSQLNLRVPISRFSHPQLLSCNTPHIHPDDGNAEPDEIGLSNYAAMELY